MRRSSEIIAAVCALAVAPALGGCAVAVVGGLAAAGGVGYEAAQERGVNGTYDDVKIKADLTSQLGTQYGDVTSTVYDGRVLLAGTTQTPQQKAQAEQIASAIPGVRGVYNEIFVGAPQTPWETVQDGGITTRVRSDLVFDADVRSGNYEIETDRGSVYLMGSARSQAELDRATQLARYVPGVQRVVSYVEIRYGVPGGQQPGLAQAQTPPAPIPPAPTGGYYPPPPPPPSGTATSNAPIQVQKLP
jgi:osmotically-inducible protein OsmY